MLTDNPNASLILIVEDDNSHALLIQRSFEDAPEEYRLERVGTLRAARVALEQCAPALVLTDYQLPDGDGREMVVLATGTCPVIIMTSHGNEQIAVEAMKIGAQDYIVKSPVAFEALPHTVALALKVWSLIQSRKQAEESLLYSVSLTNAALESTADGILVVDRSGKITRWNQKFVDLWQIPETLLSKKLDELLLNYVLEQLAHPDKFLLKVKELYEHPEESSIDVLNLANGRVYERYSQPQRIGDDIVGRFWSFRDITERKRAEEERLKLEQQFHQAQKLESLGVLAGGIAHDFNNILTVIMGHCYMARMDMIPEQEYKAAFLKMETAGQRATDLCRQMLTYAGKSPTVQTLVNLWLLVDEVVKMLQAAIKKNVAIELDLKRDVPEINGDSAQIQQIIMNLVINASEAIGDKNGTIRIVLKKSIIEEEKTEKDTFGTLIQAGRYACIEVTDSGCGMDEETQKRIFEPFFTTKFTGRGLGMSAIHGIIKSHEAILQLTSKPGVGTTFKVYFPIPVVADNAEIISTTLTDSTKTGGAILLVDDELILRNMGVILLEAHGFSAITASNGSEALEIYRNNGSEIDVILLDLIMPVMGGIEAYHELRRIDRAVPIIICSGYGVESVEHVIKNDPHAGFVHKPYKPDELRGVLMRMMKGGG